jgi:hypothetical protein
MKAAKTPRLSERLLRLTIRGLLRETDLSGKPLALVQRLIDLNGELADAGSELEVGLTTFSDGDGVSILFAARRPDEEPEMMDTQWTRRDAFDGLDDSHPELYARIPYGEIVIRERDEDEDGPCAGARIVNWTQPTLDGWGPLLYDLALELSSESGPGLAPDRSTVSLFARIVWNKYDSARTDVESHQLDTLDGDLTPDIPSDDCDQRSAENDSGTEAWSDSSLSRYYSKEGSTVMSALERAGLFWG